MSDNLELMSLVRQTENIIKRSRQISPLQGSGNGRIMNSLYENDGQTQSQLAESLGVRPQSLTRALADLESKGLISRSRDEKDRRIIIVKITEEGRQHHNRILQVRSQRADLIFDPLSETEKSELKRLLGKVISSYTNETEDNK